MSAELPAELRKMAAGQAGIVIRKQAIRAGMSSRAIEWKIQSREWRQVYRGVYAAFTGPLSRKAQLWAAVLYAGDGAVLSYESAGELQGLVDKPANVIHVTVPASRRVTLVPGLVIHISDLPERLVEYPAGEVPMTLVADTVIDLAEACASVDDVYGWVGRAFGRKGVAVDVVSMLAAVALRKKLRWRAELSEAIVAAAGGAHSALELLWEKNVEQRHGLPISRKQVPFANENGQVGFRDREYVPWGVIIELDGKKSHPNELRGQDRARDRQATVGSKETMRYGWKDVRYEACKSAVAVIRVLWRRGWRGRPRPCSARCPVAGLLAELDQRLAADPVQRQAWLEQQAVQEAAQQAEAERLAASWAPVRQMADDVARARREARATRTAALAGPLRLRLRGDNSYFFQVDEQLLNLPGNGRSEGVPKDSMLCSTFRASCAGNLGCQVNRRRPLYVPVSRATARRAAPMATVGRHAAARGAAHRAAGRPRLRADDADDLGAGIPVRVGRAHRV